MGEPRSPHRGDAQRWGGDSVPLGFVLGVFVAELVRLRERGPAWASTVEAMKGTGLAVLISFTAAVIATSLWATAAITT